MDARLKEEKVTNEYRKDMPYAFNNKMPIYCIFRVSEKKFKTIPSIKGFVKHMKRERETPNADPERFKYNEQLLGSNDLYEDTKEYLKDTKIYKNSVIGRELLLTATPQFFKGMSKQEIELWKNTNLEWLQETFKDNIRAVFAHDDETTLHLHCLLIPRIWNEKKGCYTLQNYKYFNGYQALRDMQDSYADHMQKVFPVMQRGCRYSKAKHVSIRNWYARINNNSKETDMQTLQAKAAHEEMLKMKVNYMDKTLKSFQHMNRQKDETNEKLQQENKTLLKIIEELKKNMNGKEEVLQNDNKHAFKRGFSGKRYKTMSK